MSSAPADAQEWARGALAGAIVATVGFYVGWLLWSLDHEPYESWAPIIVAPLLFCTSLPVMAKIARRTRGAPGFGLLATALALKMATAVIYLELTNALYDGVGDFTLYHDGGSRLATSYRDGIWDFDVPVPGYGFIQILTGLVYCVTGTSLLAGFLVFSWLAFWGLVLIVLAARTAIPEIDARRYSWLVLLLPSTLYWSSAVGKDAWMALAIGLCVLGVARLLTDAKGGFLLLLLGLTAAGLTRPHIGLMVFGALVLAYLVRRAPTSVLGPWRKLLGIAVIALIGIVIVQQATTFLKIDDLSPDSVETAMDRASSTSSGGGANVEPAVGGSVTRLPWAALTVLLRPFPWEAHNVQSLVTALEGVFLVALAWRSRDRLRTVVGSARRRPYLLFVAGYSVVFVYAFSSVANLGTLARERVQLVPLLLLFVCMPPKRGVKSFSPLSAARSARVGPRC